MKNLVLPIFTFLLLFLGVGSILRESSNFWECNLPNPPRGFWWKTEPMYVGADLISPNGEKVSSVVGSEVWLFSCGNISKVLKTPKDAIRAAVNCAALVSTKE